MANKQRGDVVLTIDSKDFVLRMTLGALASLETALGCDTPGELDAIIQAPTYNQILTMSHTLANFADGAEVITREEIAQSGLTWRDAWLTIADAVKASNPAPAKVEGEEGNANESGDKPAP